MPYLNKLIEKVDSIDSGVINFFQLREENKKFWRVQYTPYRMVGDVYTFDKDLDRACELMLTVLGEGR